MTDTKCPTFEKAGILGLQVEIGVLRLWKEPLVELIVLEHEVHGTKHVSTDSN